MREMTIAEALIGPTPIQRLGSFCDGNEIYIKRDDLLGFSFGGNKARIAWCFFEDAESKGADCIIAYGSVRSNLVRVVSNAAASKGWPCYVVTSVEEGQLEGESNNSLLSALFGAVIRKCSKNNVAETVRSVMSEAREMGFTPYYVYGNEYGSGNESVPVRAYARAYREIADWEAREGIRFDYCFVSSGTGMTQAGLVCGGILAESHVKVVGISVARDKARGESEVKKYIRAYLGDSFDFPEVEFSDEYLCGGYGQYDDGIVSTVRKLLLQEGIYSDLTYVGKGFAGMRKYLSERDIRKKNVLFIHTGGTPLFFDDLEILKQR